MKQGSVWVSRRGLGSLWGSSQGWGEHCPVPDWLGSAVHQRKKHHSVFFVIYSCPHVPEVHADSRVPGPQLCTTALPLPTGAGVRNR